MLQLEDIKKEEEDNEMDDHSDAKDDDKVNAGPDTDMLSTLASAALEQDPKEKTITGRTKFVLNLKGITNDFIESLLN